MQERMVALEQQLAKMQAILAIKEQQLAALQDQVQKAAKPRPRQPAVAGRTGGSTRSTRPASPTGAAGNSRCAAEPRRRTAGEADNAGDGSGTAAASTGTRCR
ncbi:hypothetical protein [Methylomicrobium agile]|uniref:hypothetical protein n=1 Tax=Methylomicrobium agile TaxID=39774 RepID=UPI0012F6FD58|nr:hypothetical protein [Methylomicrobium agile]